MWTLLGVCRSPKGHFMSPDSLCIFRLKSLAKGLGFGVFF